MATSSSLCEYARIRYEWSDEFTAKTTPNTISPPTTAGVTATSACTAIAIDAATTANASDHPCAART